jgi:tol-pal system protein YbgF
MKPECKTLLVSFILSSFLALYGCATQYDMETLQRDTDNMTKELLALQRNLYDLNTEMKNLSGKLDGLGKRNDDLQQQMTALTAETRTKIGFFEKEVETSSQPMRRYQADLGARMDQLQLDVQNLMGRFEESKYFAQKTFGETKILKESHQGKLDELERRFVALNRSLEDLEKKPAVQETKTAKPGEEGEGEKIVVAPPSPPVKAEPAKAPPEAKKAVEKPGKKPVPGPDEAYKKAYDLYTQGDIAGAKGEFKRFLEVYPKSKYAENAHYWLGECYFSEKKYDEAILEFDEVIKNYPKGNKVPDALFRQGMAFLEMKDTTNAKLIFREVIKRFPKSDQAKRASKKLKET